MKNFYEPAEDSFLLLKILKKELEKFDVSRELEILEIGVGSGYILFNLAMVYKNFNYSGIDINSFAIENTKNLFKGSNLKLPYLKKSNLFYNLKLNKKFDLIYFNTPYLPLENNEKYSNLNLLDKAIYGGKLGNEIIIKFIENLSSYLKSDGKAIILYSSLSKPEYIELKLKENLFKFKLLEKESHFFEELIIIEITKSDTLISIENKGLKKLKFLARGKHSIVFEGIYKNKEVIIKISNEQHIEKEAYFLNRLNEEKFIGKLLLKEKNYIIKEKSKGIIIKEFLKIENNKDRIIKVFNNILEICFRLDELKINKFEMTNPYKHIFIQDDLSIQMIDFERALFTNRVKNTTQFLQYILKNIKLLSNKGIFINEKKILNISKKYKLNNKFKFKFEDLFE